MSGLGELSLNSPIPSILKVNFLPHSPTLDRVGEVWNWSPWRLGSGGGSIAACRAPPSSLPGSIRDQTLSNAAQ